MARKRQKGSGVPPRSRAVKPAEREQELLDKGRAAYRAPPNGWRRAGSPTWDPDEGKGPPHKDKPTRNARILKAEAGLYMFNLANGAMARFGYDGMGLGGAEGYMTMLAQRFPLQFMTDIVSNMMPAQTTVDVNTTGALDLNVKYQSSEDARRDIGDLAVPLDLLLQRDDPPLLEVLPSPGQA